MLLLEYPLKHVSFYIVSSPKIKRDNEDVYLHLLIWRVILIRYAHNQNIGKPNKFNESGFKHHTLT
jgi:hypothetical protein